MIYLIAKHNEVRLHWLATHVLDIWVSKTQVIVDILEYVHHIIYV